MGWNGIAVMTLALGAKTDATADEWQTRKCHSSLTRLRCRHPRTPNSRWKKQPSVVLLTTTIHTAVPISLLPSVTTGWLTWPDFVNSRLPPNIVSFYLRQRCKPLLLSRYTFVISPASSQHFAGLSARQTFLN